MFLESQLNQVFHSEACQRDMRALKEGLVAFRLNRSSNLPHDAASRLGYFVESVLSSAPQWTPPERRILCQAAGEAAEFLSKGGLPQFSAKNQLRAALLYELADLPSMAGGVMADSTWDGALNQLLAHKGRFREFRAVDPEIFGSVRQELVPSPTAELLEADADDLATYQRSDAVGPGSTRSYQLARLAAYMDVGITATDLFAFSEVLAIRRRRAVKSNLEADLFDALGESQFPVEFFPAQLDALNAGLLNEAVRGWGFSAPTGTGKTFLARLLILDALRKDPAKGIVYLVPSRALVSEVSSSLAEFLKPYGTQVLAVTPQLVSLDSDEEARLQDVDIAVLTPEKADLLLRLGSNLLERCQLVVVDEAHHLEAGTRGALLELYLVRLRRIVVPPPRVVLLSAVAPNMDQLAHWCSSGAVGSSVSSVRATRMRPGVFRIRKIGGRRKGWIDFADGTSVELLGGKLQTGRKLLAQVTEALSVSGPVLVVAKGKRECENLAEQLVEDRAAESDQQRPALSTDPAMQRLDSRLRREMYQDVPMRRFLLHRVAYHHAGLPPRVRVAVEDAIRLGLVDIVFATTTLAEGVNFPFSSVVVQSLALREAPEKGRPSTYHPVTPRSFWNIAGRAGRPGVDHEGQVILFEPTLGLEKIGAVLDPYLDPELMGLDPVSSALKAAIEHIANEIANGNLDNADLTKPVLPTHLGRTVLGAINLVRVAIVHGAYGPVKLSPEEIVSETLAFTQSGASERAFLIDLFASQKRVVEGFFNRPHSPEPMTVAELGLSIDTLTQLSDYVMSLEDWQLSRLKDSMRGGTANLNQATYVIAPVAKRMGELEGGTLGGFYGEVATLWLSGAPLQEIRSRSKNEWSRLEELISVLYSRVQYLLPWGLYAFDRLVEREATARNIAYDGEIKSLAYLADSGVPSFDALRLVDLGFERVDATRIAIAYRKSGGLTSGTDVVGWIRSVPVAMLQQAVRGSDRRELDFDFEETLAKVQPGFQG